MRTRLSAIVGTTAFVAALVAMAILLKALLPQTRPSVEPPVVTTGEPTPAQSLAQTIPFTVCRSSETWTRPNEAEQAAEVWDTPRRQGIPREMLWWTFQQSFYRYYGGNSELFDAWPEAGLWTASAEDITGLCERENRNLVSAQEIELWVLLHRVIAAQRQGDVYTITVEPAPAGYQIIRVPAPPPDQLEPVTPAPRDNIPMVTVYFVDTDGREIDHLPKTPPWAAMPTAREAITVTGTVVDNAASAQVVTLQDAQRTTWSIPWLEGTIVRRADGASAHFRDIAPGMTLQVTGFQATEASMSTIAAVRVIFPVPQEVTTTQVGGLTIVEYLLVSAAVDRPDHMEFTWYVSSEVLARRGGRCVLIARCTPGNMNPDCPPLIIEGRSFSLNEVATEGDLPSHVLLIVLQDGSPVYTHTIPREYMAGSYNPVLAEWQGQWVLEVVKAGQVVINGDSLNEQLGYDTIFNRTILHGKPFYFYEQNGRVHVSYDGQTLPGISYDEIVHDRCCEPAIFNVTTCADMVACYARRGNTWYYVEMGVYGED